MVTLQLSSQVFHEVITYWGHALSIIVTAHSKCWLCKKSTNDAKECALLFAMLGIPPPLPNIMQICFIFPVVVTLIGIFFSFFFICVRRWGGGVGICVRLRHLLTLSLKSSFSFKSCSSAGRRRRCPPTNRTRREPHTFSDENRFV